MLTFRREDGVAENFHTSQNRELLEKLAQQTGGRYYKPADASKLANEISYSEAGITSRETRDLWDMPVIFLLALGIRAVGVAAAAKVGGRMKSGCPGVPACSAAFVPRLVRRPVRARHDVLRHISGLGGEPDYEQRFKMWAEDIDGSLKKAGGDSQGHHVAGAHTRAGAVRKFAEIAKQAKPADALVLMLIGHGSYDGAEYKFNIPGPDLTGAELASLLDHMPAHAAIGGRTRPARAAGRSSFCAGRTAS